MEHKCNVETCFKTKTIGGARIIYRLFHSRSDRGGYFFLITSCEKNKTEDVFLPFLSEKDDEAKAIFSMLSKGRVTPCNVLDVMDDYLAEK